jgi:hypothetical protein
VFWTGSRETLTARAAAKERTTLEARAMAAVDRYAGQDEGDRRSRDLPTE